MKNVKHFKNFFVKKSESKISCNYCGRLGHVSTSCIYRNNRFYGKTKKIWVPKGTFVTNAQGPKFIWVPKVYISYFVGVLKGNGTMEHQDMKMTIDHVCSKCFSCVNFMLLVCLNVLRIFECNYMIGCIFFF
ncbi:hypothetical protein CFOL_v3_19825 [Cephalotus follicularis]|uniref:CCHC-type domain-containing protein n=1 Tax=Cephalotus follicularis TaxID=3775 RepID=A0A1Q3C7Z5_CEPFO|nr:hypothetical protein CFOL_v3_19825 [Cephalotus follicularis]